MLKDCDVVVTSYETLRADIEWLEETLWTYCILDEGHLIGNPRSKTAQVTQAQSIACDVVMLAVLE